MPAAIATPQRTARHFELSGAIDRSRYSRIMAQLRDVNSELDAVARRRGDRQADAVDLTAMLREAAAAAGTSADVITVQLTDAGIVAVPAGDLRELICWLLDYATAVGDGRVTLRMQIKAAGNQAKPMCATEPTIYSSDVPDFLRRRLWDAVRAGHGEVSIVSEPDCCRVEFMLPIERRASAAIIAYSDAA